LVFRDGIAVLAGAATGLAAIGYTMALAFGAWAWIGQPLLERLVGA
jgi:hypothetical protein